MMRHGKRGLEYFLSMRSGNSCHSYPYLWKAVGDPGVGDGEMYILVNIMCHSLWNARKLDILCPVSRSAIIKPVLLPPSRWMGQMRHVQSHRPSPEMNSHAPPRCSEATSMSRPQIIGYRACNPIELEASLQTCPCAPVRIANEVERRTYAIFIDATLQGP
jgi:hypothetical protein